MGYTHYWGFRQAPTKAEWKKAIDLCKKIIKACNVPVQFEYDVKKTPELSEDLIRFNGVEDDGHETFYVQPIVSDFNFCKTARKPYDLVVCACLIAMKKTFGDKMWVHSDGELDDGWDESVEVANQFIEVNTAYIEEMLEEKR